MVLQRVGHDWATFTSLLQVLLLLLLLLSRFSRVRLFTTPGTAAHQAPWDFPGKSTGVGCHCHLRGPQPWPWMMQLLLKLSPLKPYSFKGEGLGGKEQLILVKLNSFTVASTKPPSLAQGRWLCPWSWSCLHRPWELIWGVGPCPADLGDLCSDGRLLLQSQRCTFLIAASPSPSGGSDYQGT